MTRARLIPWRRAGAVLAGAALLIGLGWALTLERIAYEAAEVEREAYRETSNLALAFEQHVVRTLQGLDQRMRFAEHELAAKGPFLDLRETFDEHAVGGLFSGVAILDERGRPIVSTGNLEADLSDRPWFRFHAGDPSGRLHVGAPLTGRLSGQTIIPLTRRIDRDDGTFGGAVITGVPPSYFTDFFERIDVGERGSIQLVGLDGIVRARRMGKVIHWGNDLSRSNLLKLAAQADAGGFVTTGRVDSVERFSSYQRVAGMPLLVSVGVSVDERMAPYLARRKGYLIGASAITLLILGFAATVLATLRRDAMRLARERAELEALEAVASAPELEKGDLEGLANRITDAARRVTGAVRADLRVAGEDENEAAGRGAAVLNVPVAASGRRLGRLRLEHAAPGREWASEDIGFASRLADKLATAIANRAARTHEERFRRYFEIGSVGMAISEPGRSFLEVNERLCDMLGYPAAELVSHDWAELTHPDDLDADLAQFHRVLAGEIEGYELEKRLRHKDGRFVPINLGVRCVRAPDGRVEYFVVIIEDLTRRKEAEAQMLRDAHFDRLTGLPNRTLCFDRIEQGILQAQRRGRFMAVLLLDLDRFKNVNDSLGHGTGDTVLRAAAERLDACVRAGDTVARVGGDEFAVVLQDLGSPEDAGLVAKKILDRLAAPVHDGRQEVIVTTSIGIALCPPDGEQAQALMRNADAALDRAKRGGRNMFQFYAREMNARAADQLALERDLRRAVERGELMLHYQPKAHIAGHQIVGFEALLRWNRGGAGFVSPAEFVPILEDSGLIREVGAWVIGEACRQMAEWGRAGAQPLPVAVNISAKQFHADLPVTISAALAEHGIPPSLLRVEITESDAMLDPERARCVLDELKALGVHCSIDDFGTGYSSLSYLKRFQPAELKLDRSFVSGLPAGADDASITRAVISMAHSLGMKVVAEGVETEAQRAFLQAHGCDQLQGYLLSRPLPAHDCAAFLPALREASA